MVHSVWNRMPMVINWTTPSPNTYRSTQNSQQSIQNTNEENSLILVIEQIEFISTQLDEECSSNFLNLLFFDTIKYFVSLAGCEVAEISIFFSTLYYFFVLLTHRHSLPYIPYHIKLISSDSLDFICLQFKWLFKFKCRTNNKMCETWVRNVLLNLRT